MRRAPDLEASMDWAREYVKERRHNLRPGTPHTISGVYTKWLLLLLDRSHRQHSDLVRKRCEAVLKRARRGERQAHQACIGAAVYRITGGDPLPEPLAAYVAKFLASGGKSRVARRGVDSGKNLLRDITIYNTILNLRNRFGVPPSRNKASHRESGCSIVAKLVKEECGLHCTEDAIMKIWKRFRRDPNLGVLE